MAKYEKKLREMIPSVPNSLKKLKACLSCKLIKTEHQFVVEGCENCFSTEEPQDISKLTTFNFSGMVCVIDSSQSWVSNWQRLSSLYPGVYAIDAEISD